MKNLKPQTVCIILSYALALVGTGGSVKADRLMMSGDFAEASSLQHDSLFFFIMAAVVILAFILIERATRRVVQ
ncbi:MAG: hypothetical protein WDN67_01545 [Candidatus Moraniibacteriota bacterium]